MTGFLNATKSLAGKLTMVSCIVLGLGSIAVFAQSSGSAPAPANEAPLEVRSLWLNTSQGRFEFGVEIADEAHERQKGLMFRETMPAKQGMLFDFGQTRQIQMWMRNTPLSLDMIFIKPEGTIGHIAERTTPYSDVIIDSVVPVSHVLEINAGISRLIGLKVGDRVELPKTDH